MKLLAVVFGGTALLTALLGFAVDVAPSLALTGKVLALAAMAGLALTAASSAPEEILPPFDFDIDEP